ncbi:MAG TPA: hypothetical protein VH040_12240 [Usitatibacter sp.]|jgi:hypothetical protein|nr:hypothetical protein [Usitatibacter sp.]
MDARSHYPEFLAVDEHIRRAQLQRSAHIAHLIAVGIDRLAAAFAQAGRTMGEGLAAEMDRRAVEADAFLKRAVPHR